MKKNILSLSFILCINILNSIVYSQILHNESFDATTFLPTGWVAVGTATDWSRSTTFSNPLVGVPHTGAGMARMRYPNGGTGTTPMTETISTPVFDLTGRGTNIVPVSFWIYRDSLVPLNVDSLGVFVNTTASLTNAIKIGSVARNRSVNTPDTKLVNGWYQYTFYLPSNFSGSSNYVLFQGTVYGPSTTARRIYIDDIQWSEFPPICSGTPNGGTISSSLSLICGGSGSSNLSLINASVETGISYEWFNSSNSTGPFNSIGSNAMSTSTGTINTNQYYYSLTTCLGSGISVSSDTILITVNPNPNPIVSISFANDTICRADTLNITATGATTYQWSSSTNPNLSTSATLTDLPFNTTTYSVIGADSLGCLSNPTTQTIVVGRRPTINSFLTSNDTICSGAISVLTVNASSGVFNGGVTLLYNWDPNVGITNSVSVSPIITTQYNITVVGQYGCSTSDSLMVNVNLNLISPEINLSPDSVNICQGTITPTVELVASSNTPGTIYSWTSSNGTQISSTNDSLTINVGNNTVTYIISGIDPINGCSSSAQSTIYVRPTPNVNLTSQLTNVCVNGSVILTTQVTNTQGTPISQYSFDYNPGGWNSQTVIYNPLLTGNVYVNVTSPYGCMRNDSLMITIDSTLISPTITLAASFNLLCSNNLVPIELIAISDAISPNYSWTPNFISQNNDTIIDTPQNSTNYSVTVTDQNGCSAVSLTSVLVSQAPVASFTSTLLPALNISFTNTSTNATNYLWDFGDGTISAIENPIHEYLIPGTYLVTLITTTSEGCSDSIINEIQVFGMDELNELSSNFILYPNPTNGIFVIKNMNQLNGKISLSSASGTIILKQDLTNIETQVDLTNFDFGIYFIHITNDFGGTSTYRIIKK
ncbi:MAG: T9SS C-terminal target domain-containing protein [Flavobacteriales bacterium]|nr:T9SS C-terminal target domain-containing protein [Flavobacteriales bacterium]